MKIIFLLSLLVSTAISQTLVKYPLPTPTSSTLTGSVASVPFVMGCGAGSYTTYTGQFLTCASTWPAGSSYALGVTGAADWAKFAGNTSGITIRKSVGSHRISDVTILPSSSQATFEAFQLGYYQADQAKTEAYDFGSHALTYRGGPASPNNVFNTGRYTNCYSSGLVSNCGQSFTVPVSNTFKQNYYVAIGAIGAVNGTFRVHLSDSSVPDYVFTDTDGATGTATSNGTQTEKLVTLQMQSVAAGVTATISYTTANLVSGTTAGLTIIAAGMGGPDAGARDPRTLPQNLLTGLGLGVYGAQAAAPDLSTVPTSGVTTINVAHVSASADNAALQAAIHTAVTGTGRYDIILADGFTTNASPTILLENPDARTNDWIQVKCAVLPQKPGGGDITFGQRVDKGDGFHCHIMGSSAGDRAMATDLNNSTVIRRQAHYFAFVGIEFGFPSAAAGTPMYDLVPISGIPDATDPNTGLTSANYPHHFIFDRCYFHGAIPSDRVPAINLTVSGLVTNANYVSVTGSYFEWFLRKQSGGSNEGKALWWNASAGPITLYNDHFEANSEDIICCGQAQLTVGHTGTANVTVDHNYFTKNRAEMGFTQLAKNHLEFKEVTGLSVTNNVFDNSWTENQAGQCLALNSHTGPPSLDLLSGISNVLVEGNHCSSGAGMSVNLQEELGVNYPIPPTQFPLSVSVKIHNNWMSLSATNAGGSGQAVPGQHYCFGFGGFDMGYDLLIDHNSCDYDSADLTNGSISPDASQQTGQDNSLPVTDPAKLIRRATAVISNNVMPRPFYGNNSGYYYQAFAGINMLNNEIDMPDRSGSGGGPLGLSGSAYDQGTNWYAAMKAGNPKGVINMGTNYISGCLLSAFVSSNGATCTAPPALTYPNPSRGADKPAIAAKHCEIKWGNRPDLVASSGCVAPTP